MADRQKLKFSLRKLERYHVLIGLSIFVIVFGMIGVTIEFESHAQSVYGPIHNVLGGCLDNYNNLTKSENKIQYWQCNNGESQQWTINGSTANSGTIVNQNGYCLGVLNGGTSNGTDVILYQCDGLITQQWYYDAQGGQIVNANSGTCLDDHSSSTTNGNQIDLWGCNGTGAQNWLWEPPTCPSGDTGTYPNCVAPSCPSGDTGTYPNCVAPKCPSGDTGTYPNCVAPSSPSNPSPSPGGPSPGPTSNPVQNPSGSSDLFNDLNDQSNPSSGSTLNTPSDTGGNSSTFIYNPNGTTSTVTGNSSVPVISNLTINHITSSTVTLSWNVTTGASYTVKYGTSPNKLSEEDKFSNPGTSVLITLKDLPSGKQIYMTITPTANNSTGPIKKINFKTPSSSIGGLIFAFILFILLILFIIFVVKRRSAASSTSSPVIENNFDNLPPAFPQEDQEAYNKRVNWWLPDDQQQAGQAQQPKPQDQYPDMYEEGRHRLEEEEKQRRNPPGQGQ